jgi:hypothetical protein
VQGKARQFRATTTRLNMLHPARRLAVLIGAIGVLALLSACIPWGQHPAGAYAASLIPGVVSMSAWQDIDQLVNQGKTEQAAGLVEARLAQARQSGDDAELARSLIRLVQLRIG